MWSLILVYIIHMGDRDVGVWDMVSFKENASSRRRPQLRVRHALETFRFSCQIDFSYSFMRSREKTNGVSENLSPTPPSLTATLILLRYLFLLAHIFLLRKYFSISYLTFLTKKKTLSSVYFDWYALFCSGKRNVFVFVFPGQIFLEAGGKVLQLTRSS